MISLSLQENAKTPLLCLQLYQQRDKEKGPSQIPRSCKCYFSLFSIKWRKTKQYAPGMSEQQRCRRWIAACLLESLNVTRHTQICSKHFEGGLGTTEANPLPTIFDFPKQRQDPEARRLMNTSTTNTIQKACKPGQLKVRKHNESFISEKIGSQDLLIGTP